MPSLGRRPRRVARHASAALAARLYCARDPLHYARQTRFTRRPRSLPQGLATRRGLRSKPGLSQASPSTLRQRRTLGWLTPDRMDWQVYKLRLARCVRLLRPTLVAA